MKLVERQDLLDVGRLLRDIVQEAFNPDAPVEARTEAQMWLRLFVDRTTPSLSAPFKGKLAHLKGLGMDADGYFRTKDTRNKVEVLKQLEAERAAGAKESETPSKVALKRQLADKPIKSERHIRRLRGGK